MKKIKKHPGRSGNSDPNIYLRNHRCELHLSEFELNIIKIKFQKSGHKSLASFIRDSAIKTTGPSSAILLQHFRECITALNRIGNNLNQVARHVNTFKKNADTQAINLALQMIESEVSDIAKNLNHKKQS